MKTNIQSKMINIATKILCRRVSSRELSIGFREQGNWGIYFREQGIFSIYFQGTSRFLGTREHQSILNNIFFKLSEPTKYKIYYVLYLSVDGDYFEMIVITNCARHD